MKESNKDLMFNDEYDERGEVEFMQEEQVRGFDFNLDELREILDKVSDAVRIVMAEKAQMKQLKDNVLEAKDKIEVTIDDVGEIAKESAQIVVNIVEKVINGASRELNEETDKVWSMLSD